MSGDAFLGVFGFESPTAQVATLGCEDDGYYGKQSEGIPGQRDWRLAIFKRFVGFCETNLIFGSLPYKFVSFISFLGLIVTKFEKGMNPLLQNQSQEDYVELRLLGGRRNCLCLLVCSGRSES